LEADFSPEKDRCILFVALLKSGSKNIDQKRFTKQIKLKCKAGNEEVGKM
jgi:hypothetical protein